MKILADSHVLIWWLSDTEKLNPLVRAAIHDTDNTVFFSAASIWEIGLKVAKGHLKVPYGLAEVLRADGFDELPVLVAHAERALTLPAIHGDPFDRMLIAQALHEGLVLATRDHIIAQYNVPLLKA
ncbi:MAG: type II toxin-antitoxin system VapC family toxin [Puniceicoccales bacterium]|jgi:PIN domain nuclease of toxin-antitoxin system|nr:type II toxin-antitoxin system VapC family toxin [Puniceicoccales bacterium]